MVEIWRLLNAHLLSEHAVPSLQESDRPLQVQGVVRESLASLDWRRSPQLACHRKNSDSTEGFIMRNDWCETCFKAV